jgi:cell division protein FtsI (penicillin-binding protein 3)
VTSKQTTNPVTSAQKPPKFAFWQNAKLAVVRSRRLLFVWGIILAAGLGLGAKLYWLQVVRAPELTEKAQQQHRGSLHPYVPRRPIADRNGNVVATDQLTYTLYAHPKLFEKPRRKIATQLAEVLKNQTEESLRGEFRQKESGIRIADNLTEAIADEITNLSLNGLELIQGYSRIYPQQKLAAEVVGYVNRDRNPQAGVEYTQQELLQRRKDVLQVRRAGNGELMPQSLPEGALQLDNLQLQLTLDMRLQRAARSALEQQIEEFNAKRGTVMVMDVRDGSILALVEKPTYNPNRYFEYKMGRFNSWAVSDLYEPGSTFKPINVAIALDANAIQPNSVFDDPGKIRVGSWQITNWDFDTEGGHGKLTVAEILQKSSNVGMVKLMRNLKPPVYYQALKELELEKEVDIGLPGASAGNLKDRIKFFSHPIEAATTAFGQGFSLTPLKLAQLHAAIANGGKLVTPHVVRGLVNPQGQVYASPDIDTKRIFSPETSKTVLKMMESVVEQGGGKNAQIGGYEIAGKTGTAEKANSQGGYSDAKITSFVGILTVDSPRYLVLAVVDEPKKEPAFGSTVAAPIVKSVMESIIAIERIPPSGEVEGQGSRGAEERN